MLVRENTLSLKCHLHCFQQSCCGAPARCAEPLTLFCSVSQPLPEELTFTLHFMGTHCSAGALFQHTCFSQLARYICRLVGSPITLSEFYSSILLPSTMTFPVLLPLPLSCQDFSIFVSMVLPSAASPHP